MKKSIFAAALSALLSLSLAAQTVAVFDFDCDDPNFKEDVSVMTDLLVHELVKAGDVTVVERKKMDKTMAEYAFQANPYVDISGAKKTRQGRGRGLYNRRLHRFSRLPALRYRAHDRCGKRHDNPFGKDDVKLLERLTMFNIFVVEHVCEFSIVQIARLRISHFKVTSSETEVSELV